VTDFASLPLGVFIKSPGGKWDKPAIIHDELYKTPLVAVAGGTAREVTRAQADAIFLEAMDASGVNWFTKRIIYSGVRVGGWKAWNAHRKAEDDAGTDAA
jgi:hypothetical protein